MRYPKLIVGFSLLALLLTLHPSNANDGKTQIKATQTWSGKIGDDVLSKAAPKSGYLTTQKALEELWTAWKLKDKSPTIDFKKQIVFVQLSLGGPNVPRSTYTLDGKGNLTVLSMSTLIGGPGFGYSIDVVNREGIKTYQGRPLEAAPEKK